MKTVSSNEVKKYVDGKKNGVIINVLPEKSHRKAHIPNSINIPIETPDFSKKVNKLVDSKNDDIIVYCANTDCHVSDKAVEKLTQDGFSNVKDFSGGIKEWNESNFPLARHPSQ